MSLFTMAQRKREGHDTKEPWDKENEMTLGKNRYKLVKYYKQMVLLISNEPYDCSDRHL